MPVPLWPSGWHWFPLVVPCQGTGRSCRELRMAWAWTFKVFSSSVVILCLSRVQTNAKKQKDRSSNWTKGGIKRKTCRQISWKIRVLWSHAGRAGLQSCSWEQSQHWPAEAVGPQCLSLNACLLCRSCWLNGHFLDVCPCQSTSLLGALVSSPANWDSNHTYFDGRYFVCTGNGTL